MISSGMGMSEVASLKLSDFVDSLTDYVEMPLSMPFDVGVY